MILIVMWFMKIIVGAISTLNTPGNCVYAVNVEHVKFMNM